MKGMYAYIAGIGLLLGVLWWWQGSMPKRFVWIPTYHHLDKEPFGCAVFDSLLSVSLPQGYRVSDQSLYRLCREDSARVFNVLVQATSLHMDSLDKASLFGLARRGGRILLAAESFHSGLADTLGFHYPNSWLRTIDGNHVRQSPVDTLRWAGGGTPYTARDFPVQRELLADCPPVRCDSAPAYPQQVPASMSVVYYKDWGKQARVQDSSALVVRISVGKGQIWVVHMPRLLTNYGVLDRRYTDCAMRLLNPLQNAPLVRTQSYLPAEARQLYGGRDVEGKNQSLLGYFVQHRPLRWALWTTLAVLAVFFLGNARRKQRPIPVVRPPVNRGLEFVKLVGTLYYRHEPPTMLVRKKYLYFADEVKRLTGMDLQEELEQAGVHGLAVRLAAATGLDAEKLDTLFRRLKELLQTSCIPADAREMKQLADRMDEILARLSA